MKKIRELLLVIMENIGLILGIIFFVAIIDLIGLGGKADIGLGFIFGFLLAIFVGIFYTQGRWEIWKEKLKSKL